MTIREVSSEITKFQNDPIAWLQEWNQKNGRFSCEEIELDGKKVFMAQLWVEGYQIALSTGVAPTLNHACINAIAGIDSVVTW